MSMKIREDPELRISNPAAFGIPVPRSPRRGKDARSTRERTWNDTRKMTILGLCFVGLLLGACNGAGSNADSGSSGDLEKHPRSAKRSPEFDPSHPMYYRFEGTGADNACSSDPQCVVGGCSGEVCAAESIITTCEVLDELPRGACQCVEALCVWTEPEVDECSSDADCRIAANYCGGCHCEALAPGEEAAPCKDPVACLLDPCHFLVAVCDDGTCSTANKEK